MSRDGILDLERKAKRVIPNLALDTKIRSFGAARPEPYKSTFEKENGFPIFCDGTFFSFLGIKTPGITCANELGILAADKIAQLLNAEENSNFDPVQLPKQKIKDLSLEEWSALTEKHPEYGKVVCICRNITEGEVIDSIRDGAANLAGVKRRTHACTGPCQGTRCSALINQLLSEAQNDRF